ncbi:MAG: preprotein translocase subunit SecG [Planctomycetota bacterium]|nr:preprotein translocase subunit SecG [Planctomycetota bacterium]
MLAVFWGVMIFFLILCVILTLLVLIQKGRGGGLAGAFGGGGGNTAFGTKTGDVLTWATSIIFGLFVVLAVVLNLIANKIGNAPNPAAASAIKVPVGPSDSNPMGAGAPAPTTQPGR